MTGREKFSFFVFLAIIIAVAGSCPSAAQQTSVSLQCSLRADARGLHGAERKAFRTRCKTGATVQAAPAARTPQKQIAHDHSPVRQQSPKLELQTSGPEALPKESPPRTNSSAAPLIQLNEIEHRVALVIGNWAYKNVPSLINPQRDAEAVADVLKHTGFESVTLKTNLSRDQLLAVC
jgi:hypothetical protein